jgi:pimeloyl-ACP methyl ester carboxylesterase
VVCDVRRQLVVGGSRHARQCLHPRRLKHSNVDEGMTGGVDRTRVAIELDLYWLRDAWGILGSIAEPVPKLGHAPVRGGAVRSHAQSGKGARCHGPNRSLASPVAERNEWSMFEGTMHTAQLLALTLLPQFSFFAPSAANWLRTTEVEAQATEPAQVSSLQSQERTVARLLELAKMDPRLDLERAEHKKSNTVFVRGFCTVFENRSTGEGRKIRLGMVVLPARAENPEPDPVFFLHGGPGAAATSIAKRQISGWMRETRDLVFIDQRGTGSSNALRVPIGGSDDDLQTYLKPYFDVEAFRAALPEIEARADISQYTTPNSVDDFDEVRDALGYERINLRGGSYGTRSALVYMRRHTRSIRSATLQGIQPIAYLNPLPHARGAQESLDLIFDEIEASEKYRKAFPNLRENFTAILKRLERDPAEVVVSHPKTKEDSTVLLRRNAFAEAVRLQLYSMPSNRRLPLLLSRAHTGDYRELVQAAILQSRSVRNMLAWGMLIAVTESEDISRIDPADIGSACAGTFLGRTRIDEQLAIAEFWPSGSVAKNFSDPVSVSVPTLLWSGTHDPSTTPAWGAEAASHLPNSLHIVIPSGHGVFGPEVERLDRTFLERGSVKGLDISDLEALTLPPLVLPVDWVTRV